MEKEAKCVDRKKTKEIWEIRVSFFVSIVCIIIFTFLSLNADKVRIAFFYDSMNFIKTSAEIVESNRTSYHPFSGKGTSFFKRYRANISYRFVLNGISHTSNSFQLDTRIKDYSSKGAADQLLSRYPKGAIVNIYYEKSNPSLSFIKLKDRKYVLLDFIVFIIVSIFFFLRGVILYKKLEDGNKGQVFRFKKIEINLRK